MTWPSSKQHVHHNPENTDCRLNNCDFALSGKWGKERRSWKRENPHLPDRKVEGLMVPAGGWTGEQESLLLSFVIKFNFIWLHKWSAVDPWTIKGFNLLDPIRYQFSFNKYSTVLDICYFLFPKIFSVTFSLAYFIIRGQHTIHMTYKVHVNQVLSVQLPVTSRHIS